MGGVPERLLQKWQNYAQNLQLSIRGHGTRSTLDVHGIQIYIDGTPSTMLYGQGQANNNGRSSFQQADKTKRQDRLAS